MNSKVLKIFFQNGKKYFIFVFLSVFLSLSSYILGLNTISGVGNYLISEIKPIIGADITISNNKDLDEVEFRDRYGDGFEIAKTITLDSTIFDSSDEPTLVELNFHSNNYPLYDSFSYDIIDSGGDIIVDRDIYDKFGDDIAILGMDMRVRGIVKNSLVSDLNIYSGNRSIYIPIEHLELSEDTLNNSHIVLNPSISRLKYKYYLVSRGDYSPKYKDIFKGDSSLEGFNITSIDDRNEFIGDITDRFFVFINFFNLVVFGLAFFIVGLSLEIYFKKLSPTIGLLNIFGLRYRDIFIYNILILSIIFSIAFGLRCVLNIIVINILGNYYEFFTVYYSSLIKGGLIGIILLIMGSFSPIFKIFKSKIGDLLRDLDGFNNFGILDYIIYLGIIFIGFISISHISNIDLYDSIIYSFIIVFFIVVFYILINLALKAVFNIIKSIDIFRNNFYIFDALRSTIRPGNISFLMIFSSIVSFLSIFIFVVFSYGFIDFLHNITDDSNDTFIINIQKRDLDTIEKYFLDDEIYEIVQLKIKSINNKSLKDYLGVDKVPNNFSREFFSTTANLDNKIIKGKNLSAGHVSVDIDFGESLGLRIGDEIAFSVAGLDQTLKIVNFREAVRNGANPFFYFQLYPSDFEKYPKNYIVSYDSSSKSPDLDINLSHTLYGATFIKTRDLVDMIIGVAKNILLVIYLMLGYIFIFSFMSFMVSIEFLKTFKTSKIRLLNILGGHISNLVNATKLEFIYLITIAMVFSAIFGMIFLSIIYSVIRYFSLDIVSISIGIFVLIILTTILGVVVMFSRFSSKT